MNSTTKTLINKPRVFMRRSSNTMSKKWVIDKRVFYSEIQRRFLYPVISMTFLIKLSKESLHPHASTRATQQHSMRSRIICSNKSSNTLISWINARTKKWCISRPTLYTEVYTEAISILIDYNFFLLELCLIKCLFDDNLLISYFN